MHNIILNWVRLRLFQYRGQHWRDYEACIVTSHVCLCKVPMGLYIHALHNFIDIGMPIAHYLKTCHEIR